MDCNNFVIPRFSKTYNPILNLGNENNILNKIKKMLLSRSVTLQKQATAFIIENLTSSHVTSEQRQTVIKYLLSNDICIFLCESMATDHCSLLSYVMRCFRLLSSVPDFYTENHAPYVTTSIIRTIHFYLEENSDWKVIDPYLGFISETFYSVRYHGLAPAIASNSMFNTEQLLMLLTAIVEKPTMENSTKMASSLVLLAVMSYEAKDYELDLKVLGLLTDVIEKWFLLLCDMIQDFRRMMRTDNKIDIFYGVLCQLGIGCLRLCKYLTGYKLKENFIHKHIMKENEIDKIKLVTKSIATIVYKSMLIIVTYTKDFQEEINDHDYALFLKFLNAFFHEAVNRAIIPEFSEVLVEKGYLCLLPRSKYSRALPKLKMLSDVNLCDILIQLSHNYLETAEWPGGLPKYEKYLQNGLMGINRELDYWPQLLDKNKTNSLQTAYSVLIYLYFYCLSSPSPQVTSGPLLPFLVKHLLCLPKTFNPPIAIVKCLWLVFSGRNGLFILSYTSGGGAFPHGKLDSVYLSMAQMSNFSWNSLDERVLLERAICKLVRLVQNKGKCCYTHHPVLVLWAFTSHRIPQRIQCLVVEEWLDKEVTLPSGLSGLPTIWYSLLYLIQCTDSVKVIKSAKNLLEHYVVSECEPSDIEDIATMIWESFPDTLANLLVNCSHVQVIRNNCLLDLASKIIPEHMGPEVYERIALLLATYLITHFPPAQDDDLKLYFQCLKQAFLLCNTAIEQNNPTVLLMFINRAGFLENLLIITEYTDEEFSCMALKLLSYFVHCYSRYQPRCNKVIELDPAALAITLHSEKSNFKLKALLQMIYTIMNNANPSHRCLVTLKSYASEHQTIRVFKSIMFRLQMICCKERKEESANGWQTLNALLKYGVNCKSQNFLKSFVMQPWYHILIRLQLQQQNYITAFLKFLKNWLFCLKIIRQERGCGGNTILMKTVLQIEQTFSDRDLKREFSSQKCEIIDLILTTIENLDN